MNSKDSYRKRKIAAKKRRLKKRVIRALIAIITILVLVCIWICVSVIHKNQKVEDKNPPENQKSQESVVYEAKEQETGTAVITLEGEEKTQLLLGTEYNEPGYKAKDKEGNDLTEQVTVDTSALNRAGNQKIIYSVADEKGRITTVEREVEVLPNTQYSTNGLPICMYHYVYDANNPPEKIDSNFITVETLAEEMKYLHDNGYYFPTWQEVRDYVEGKQLLPEKSIVITFDDGPNYMDLGIPVLEQYETPATSFVIASYWDSREMLYEYASDYLRFESHSYKMHQGGGGIGHGGIYTTMSKEEVLADLNKSFEICGNKDAFAYPFGDYTEEGCSTLEEAGLLCAVTTENNKCYPGDNPMMLPRVRMRGSQSLESFISVIN